MLSDTHLVLNQAIDCLSRGDIAGAESSARAALAATKQKDANALHVMGLVRLRQGQWEEAAKFLREANAAKPGQPVVLLQLGQALGMQRRPDLAIGALSEAVTLQPDFAEAWFEMGNQQQLMGQVQEAETSLRRALTLQPGHAPAKFGLSRLLNAENRHAEAESALTQSAGEWRSPELEAAMLDHLLTAQLRQSKAAAALQTVTRLETLNPGQFNVLGHKADLLLDLKRFDEALAVMKIMLAQDPVNIRVQEQYNHILYQLGRENELLKSYDMAPPTTDIQFSKALFALTMQRGEEAEKLFSQIVTREPDNISALVSVAAALDVAGRHDAAMQMMEKALAQHPDDLQVLAQVASTALHQRDPEKAEAMLQRVLAVTPFEGFSLARLSTAWRMMDDKRDEELMGYDDLVQVFDLEPPKGFSNMAAFNQELEAYLGAMHPPTREFLGQSLRGGTQTRRSLFGAGHDLVERLKLRIDDAVARYIADMGNDLDHPLRARRGGNFAFAGAWSSRLADCGFHVNHIHPMGWISSCYYVGLPEAIKDEQAKQGWIKFGEPPFDAGIGFRRAIQPAPGRLVLFPSYMWHGTIPFQENATRTTIAFDVLPG